MGLSIYAHSPMRPTNVITPGLLCKDSANERNVRMLTFAECSLSSLFWMQRQCKRAQCTLAYFCRVQRVFAFLNAKLQYRKAENNSIDNR